MDRLFVYGIFLSESNRQAYQMTNPSYATVKGYITVGDVIVQAVRVNEPSIALTGLVVDIPTSQWLRLDQLETGYDRIRVTTTNGERAYMYAERSYDENQRGIHNSSGEQPQEQRVQSNSNQSRA